MCCAHYSFMYAYVCIYIYIYTHAIYIYICVSGRDVSHVRRDLSLYYVKYK